MNTDQKLLETVFFIAICRPTGDKWQWKALFLKSFDIIFIMFCYSINVFDCRLPSVNIIDQAR